ncbi:MAG TPA: hypothetical protein VGK47_07835 [Nitrososphaeraceae archaeon]
MKIKTKRGRRNRSMNNSTNPDEKKNDVLDDKKNKNVDSSAFASILSFWQQQYFPTRWNEMYNEYIIYAKKMAQINEEFVTRSQRMAQIYVELSENAQRINELFKESIELTEVAYRNWLNACYSFLNGNKMRSPLSAAIEKNEKAMGKATTSTEDANLTKDEQKSINNMFRDSLTFD